MPDMQQVAIKNRHNYFLHAKDKSESDTPPYPQVVVAVHIEYLKKRWESEEDFVNDIGISLAIYLKILHEKSKCRAKCDIKTLKQRVRTHPIRSWQHVSFHTTCTFFEAYVGKFFHEQQETGAQLAKEKTTRTSLHTRLKMGQIQPNKRHPPFRRGPNLQSPSTDPWQARHPPQASSRLAVCWRV